MKIQSRFRSEFLISLAVAALVVVTVTETASAKCGPQRPIRLVSTSKVIGLHVDFERKNTFAIKRNGEIIASGELNVSGHHLTGLIDDTGASFVLHDQYEGLTIYNATGQVVGRFAPQQLLSFRELKTRPGKWACHSQGHWSSSVALGFDGTSLEVQTHTGRKLVIDLVTAEILHEEPDWVQHLTVAAGMLSLLLGGTLCWWLWQYAKRERPK